MKTPIPRLYLGTMTFAWSSQTSSVVDHDVALEMLQRFVSCNEKHFSNNGNKDDNNDETRVVHRVDTARIYAGGKTEPMVGAVVKELLEKNQYKKRVVLGTKAHPSQVGGLSPAGIQQQMDASLEALGTTKAGECWGEYYLHQPDPEHPLQDSLQYLNDFIQNAPPDDDGQGGIGKNTKIGMSNYHASEVQRAFDVCNQHGWTAAKPAVYQGLYNPLNRAVEQELLPILRQNQCAFVAYNPLAAGMLTGKHTSLESPVQAGRFRNNENYLPRFYTPANFQALELIRKACEQEGITMVEATYRWLLRHSALNADRGDGILLGASSVEQLSQNLQACVAASKKGPLSNTMLQAFDQAWELTKSSAFPYWRSYSADMPNRENLDQGASYNAVKKK